MKTKKLSIQSGKMEVFENLDKELFHWSPRNKSPIGKVKERMRGEKVETAITHSTLKVML